MITKQPWATLPHRLPGLLSLLTLICLAGCGGKHQVKVYPASGTVTIDAKPPGKSKIVFQSSESEKHPSAAGAVAEDGSFQLTTYSANDGIAVGKYEVVVVSDPMAMKAIPTTSPFSIEIKPDGSGKIAPLKIALESKKGAKPNIGAPLPLPGGGAASPPTPGAAPR